ncbi:MAG: pyrrolo-quinoline quinone [Planctomycetota bacterium]|nr:MAG: pyrrolo-quinoline quinone [Planctomycetota bacterium]REK20309.1 MAG: pyrrolo-quinoline quinone [Planctomycetota bacterium]
MRHALARGVLLLVVIAASTPAGGDDQSPAADWPQFRGPGGQGHAAPESKPPLTWSEVKGVAWKTDVAGLGHSSPVVQNGQVWVTTASRDGAALGAVAFALDSGRTLHSVTIFRPRDVLEIHHDNSYASPTPAIDDGRLYCHFGRYGTACLDASSGEVLWTCDELVIEHGGGPGSSPVLYGDYIIVNCDGADAQYVVALDKQTGRIAWKSPRSAPYRKDPITHRAFSTPLLIEHNGQPQLISPGADQLQSYDPQTGAELWQVRYIGFSTIPCPVYADGRAYFCTGYFKPELWAVRVDGRGDVTDSHVDWKFRGAVPDTPSPCLVDGRLYCVSNTGVGTVIEAETGRQISRFRMGGNYSASPLYAGGRLYFCSEEGHTKIIEPVERPKVIASNRVAGSIKASPALAGDSLILRTTTSLYRIDPESP